MNSQIQQLIFNLATSWSYIYLGWHQTIVFVYMHIWAHKGYHLHAILSCAPSDMRHSDIARRCSPIRHQACRHCKTLLVCHRTSDIQTLPDTAHHQTSDIQSLPYTVNHQTSDIARHSLPSDIQTLPDFVHHQTTPERLSLGYVWWWKVFGNFWMPDVW